MLAWDDNPGLCQMGNAFMYCNQEHLVIAGSLAIIAIASLYFLRELWWT